MVVGQFELGATKVIYNAVLHEVTKVKGTPERHIASLAAPLTS